MMKRLMLVVPMVAMVGCSGSMSGTVGGVSLNVADAIFAVLKDDSGNAVAALVVLADVPKICDSLKANRDPKSATSLILSMYKLSSTGTLAPDPGDYTVATATGAGSFAGAAFNHSDSTCKNTLAADASTGKSGLVKLTALTAAANGTASGTYDITFGAGDKVTGNFNASYCDISKLATATPNCE